MAVAVSVWKWGRKEPLDKLALGNTERGVRGMRERRKTMTPTSHILDSGSCSQASIVIYSSDKKRSSVMKPQQGKSKQYL